MIFTYANMIQNILIVHLVYLGMALDLLPRKEILLKAVQLLLGYGRINKTNGNLLTIYSPVVFRVSHPLFTVDIQNCILECSRAVTKCATPRE